MLILTRRVGEKLIIEANGKKIELEVSNINGKQAKLTFFADKDVSIDREEIYEAKKKMR